MLQLAARAELDTLRCPGMRAELGDVVARVRALRPRLVDQWETTALIESLGYTDGRVQRELGFSDTLEAGEYIYQVSRRGEQPAQRWSPPDRESALTIAVRSAASTLIYAVPWLAVFVAQVLRPDALRLPTRVAPALAIALMFSLVASGGFVQAIVRRGEFYIGLRQVGMARHIVAAVLKVGTMVIVAAAAFGVLLGWYFELFTWPSLVLGADAFIIMSLLWMVCGTFGIRQQQWRVAAAFVAGFAAFALTRTAGTDVVTSQLVAAATVLVAAALQSRAVFGEGDGRVELPASVPLPRLSVIVYWTAPYFLYGTIYFAFLFADRLAAGSASVALAGQPFGIPAQYNLGMEMALLTLLIAASGVEVAAALFGRAFTREAVRPMCGGDRPFTLVIRRHHHRAVALTLVTFGAAAVLIAVLSQHMLGDAMTHRAQATLLVGDLAYGCLAIGLLNALLLFETRRPWLVAQAFSTALAINLVTGYLASHVLGGFFAVYGLLFGALYFAVASTIAVRRTLARSDYAFAVA